MSILVDGATRVLVQGITGSQGRFDTGLALAYGTAIVAGVTPGKGGTEVFGIPVFDTVEEAVAVTGATAAVSYVPAARAAGAVEEAVAGGLRLVVATTENVPRHDAARAVAAARAAGTALVGFNTNGVISPGRAKLGGIGGDRPDRIFRPGRVGICSRSGGMAAEIAATLGEAGLGVSTCVAMGGDPITGLAMADYARLFQEDRDTDAIVVFGEPGTRNEQDLAAAIAAGEVTKPVVALLAGHFQEAYPAGASFGHLAAAIRSPDDRVSRKAEVLRAAGARVAGWLEDIPALLAG